MYYTYTLLLKNTKIYSGSTNDLKRRLNEHQLGKVLSTKNQRPIELIFYEAFVNKKDAERREKYFKTDKGKKMLKVILREYFKTAKQN